MRDWRELMESKGEYSPGNHNLTDQLYKYPSGNYIEFFSVDDAKRVRGPGRDILHINEANLLSLETFRQLSIRTKKVVIMDYNPADEFSWIYDEVLPKKNCKFIQTTYLDNPWITKEQRSEIESLKDIDPNFWKVYGLGERGTAQETIFPSFQSYSNAYYSDYCFGLDFGFTHATALVKTAINEKNLYLEEMFYKTHTSTPELIDAIKSIVGHKYVYCDSARPDAIEELRKAGINAHEANKAVKEGINFMKSHNIFVHQESLNLQKEMRSYKWKTLANGRTIDEPIKAFDDAIDAARYGAVSHKVKKGGPAMSVHR